MSSSLKSQLSEAVKDAMRARDSARLGTLRLLQAAVKQKEVDERKELTDADITAIIEKQVKQRRESISAYEQAGRTETAEQEKAEIAVLQEFLPAAAEPAEIDAAITAALDEVQAQGASGPAAMGKVMALLKTRLAGRADMSAVSAQVKARLM
ncbi:MAG TPA: GatB/YqeY domain-containing protein [Burkholderiaceae bacterium]|jgi:uncharacterized protein YqeY|nr:GatB/YqeY domain-containing protein [Burkholderiaceae bacterium]